MIRFSYILFGLLLLTGCKDDIPDFERTDFEINGQEFEILLTHEIFNNYLKEYKKYKKTYVYLNSLLVLSNP